MSIENIETRPTNPISQVDPFTRAKVIAAESALRMAVARGLGDAVHMDGGASGAQLASAHLEAELMARFTSALASDVIRSTAPKLTEEESRRIGKIQELAELSVPERDAMTALWALEDSALGAAMKGEEVVAHDLCDAYSTAFETIGPAGREYAERSGFELSPPDELTAAVRERLSESAATGIAPKGEVSLRRLGSAFGISDVAVRAHLAHTPLRAPADREEIAIGFKRLAAKNRAAKSRV